LFFASVRRGFGGDEVLPGDQFVLTTISEVGFIGSHSRVLHGVQTQQFKLDSSFQRVRNFPESSTIDQIYTFQALQTTPQTPVGRRLSSVFKNE